MYLENVKQQLITRKYCTIFSVVLIAGIIVLFSISFMVCSTQVELEDELITQEESNRNNNYVKDLSYGKDNIYYKSTYSNSIIKINCINNNINIIM